MSRMHDQYLLSKKKNMQQCKYISIMKQYQSKLIET